MPQDNREMRQSRREKEQVLDLKMGRYVPNLSLSQNLGIEEATNSSADQISNRFNYEVSDVMRQPDRSVEAPHLQHDPVITAHEHLIFP